MTVPLHTSENIQREGLHPHVAAYERASRKFSGGLSDDRDEPRAVGVLHDTFWCVAMLCCAVLSIVGTATNATTATGYTFGGALTGACLFTAVWLYLGAGAHFFEDHDTGHGEGSL